MQVNRCINCMQPTGGGWTCPHCGAPQRVDEKFPYALLPNTILHGKYLIGRVLGQGGFGITYVGFDLTLEMKVAVKEYFPIGQATRTGTLSSQIHWNSSQIEAGEAAAGVQEFLKEARRMAKLDSVPAIVRVRDTFPDNGTAYIVMDFVDGETMKAKLMKTGPMSFENCVAFLDPLLQSLDAMHAHGLVHRDISPDNIMVKPDGTPCLLDLGAAKDLTRTGSQSTQMVMKKGFSPLEQCTSSGKIGPWTDVYALTATIYYAVTGKSVPNIMDRVGGGADTLDFTTIKGQTLSPAVQQVLRAGLAIRVEDRIQSVRDLRNRLAAAAKGQPAGPPGHSGPIGYPPPEPTTIKEVLIQHPEFSRKQAKQYLKALQTNSPSGKNSKIKLLALWALAAMSFLLPSYVGIICGAAGGILGIVYRKEIPARLGKAAMIVCWCGAAVAVFLLILIYWI